MGPLRGSAVLEREAVDAPIRVDTRAPQDVKRNRRRAVTLLLLSAVLPGTAQLAAGNRALGRLALRVWLGMIGAVALVGLLAFVSRSAALTLVTHRWTLAVLQFVLLGFAALWAVVLVDAWRLGRPDRLPQRDRRGLLVLLVMLLVVLPGGAVYAGVNVGAARAAMTSVFASGDAVGAVDGRYNILLLGGDSGVGRTGLRPDSIQLASVDAETGRAVLFGFSRETENIRFRPGSVMAGLMPEGWTCGDECLLNGLYTWGTDHASEFPKGTGDPGLVATTEAVEALSGLDIQYYVLVDLKGFRSLVDAVGGLDIAVQRRTPIGSQHEIKGWIKAGNQHLDGYHALWYARSRANSTNYERMARQRCVVTAMVRQLDPQTVLLHFGDIAKATKGVFRTDIPQGALASLADLAVRTKQQKITSVNFVPPLIKPWSYDPAVVHRAVDSAIRAAEEQDEAAAEAPKAGTTASAPTATATSKPAKPKKQAVMESPAADPDANTSDLATVCSVG
ncbi:MAG TPA: LCP family protein [Ornithinibacter sp.]|nr:LCP family protein [Ornithinibacter sp.]